MGVAVLQPHDCLSDRYPHHHQPLISPPRPKLRSNPNPNPNPKSNQNRSRRNKRSSNGSPSPPPQSRPSRANSPVTGQIRILKRGEELSPVKQPPPPPPPKTASPSASSGDSANKKKTSQPKGECPIVSDTPWNPKSILQEVNPIIGFYAGSSVASPPPSSLPLPAFFTKKKISSFSLGDAAEEVATNGLRRLLKIDGI